MFVPIGPGWLTLHTFISHLTHPTPQGYPNQPMPNKALYIHIPWCVKKCPYCDFNSHQQRDDIPVQAYLDRLKQEFQSKAALLADQPIYSIFIGGGTPSLMPGWFYQELLSFLSQSAELPENTEITLEANPGTVEQQRFSDFRAAGINRLSIGIQSLDDQQLKTLGRIHDSQAAIKAIASAKAAGFQRINADIMFGLPQQTINAALLDLELVLNQAINHLSWYQLTLEPNTLFYRQPPNLPDDDLIWDMQQQGQALLAKHGFQQYEISAYGKDGDQCQHNLNYWYFGDYIGLGAGAHSKITLADGRISRHWNYKHPKDYLAPGKEFIANAMPVDNVALEFFMNRFRVFGQIRFEELPEAVNMADIKKSLLALQKQGLLQLDQKTIELTALGRQYLNTVLEHLV